MTRSPLKVTPATAEVKARILKQLHQESARRLRISKPPLITREGIETIIFWIIACAGLVALTWWRFT